MSCDLSAQNFLLNFAAGQSQNQIKNLALSLVANSWRKCYADRSHDKSVIPCNDSSSAYFCCWLVTACSFRSDVQSPKSLYISHAVSNFNGTDIESWALFEPVNITEKKIWANYEQLLRVFFSCFHGQFFF